MIIKNDFQSNQIKYSSIESLVDRRSSNVASRNILECQSMIAGVMMGATATQDDHHIIHDLISYNSILVM